MMPNSVAIRILTRRTHWLHSRIGPWESERKQPALHFRGELGALRVALLCLGADMDGVPGLPPPRKTTIEALL